MEEIWKEVYDNGIFTGRKVSNFGRIKMPNGEFGALSDNGAGYLSASVRSWKDEVRKWNYKREYIHRLVAMYFLPNPDNLPQVNHKDCDKSNNHVGNLEWSLRSKNILHAHSMGRMSARSDLKKLVTLTAEQVIELYTSVVRDKVGITVKANDLGVPRTTASSILNKRSRANITDTIDVFLKSANVFYDRLPTREDLGLTTHNNLMRNPDKRVKGASGVTGITLTSVDGVAYWLVIWNIGDGRKSKYFNTEKYGHEEAFIMACEHRLEQIGEVS